MSDRANPCFSHWIARAAIACSLILLVACGARDMQSTQAGADMQEGAGPAEAAGSGDGKITFQARDLPVRVAIEQIAAEAGLEFVAADGVDLEHVMSFDFQEIPLQVALDMIGAEFGAVAEVGDGQVRFLPAAAGAEAD